MYWDVIIMWYVILGLVSVISFISLAHVIAAFTKWSEYFDNRPHRRTWTVQWYSPVGASVHPPLNTCFLGPNRVQIPNSRFCTAYRRLTLYFTMGLSVPLQNCPFPWEI